MSLFDTPPVMRRGPCWQGLSMGSFGRTLRWTVTQADRIGIIGVTGCVAGQP